MWRRIENFLGQFDQNRAIVTSRPAGYKRDFFRTEEFPHYWLQSFNDPKGGALRQQGRSLAYKDLPQVGGFLLGVPH